MDKQWVVGIVIPEQMRDVESVLKRVVDFYQQEACQLVIINQHEDRWTETLAEYYVLTGQVSWILSAAQQEFQQWGLALFQKFDSALISFVFLNEPLLIHLDHSVVNEGVVVDKEEPIQLSQLIQSTETWQNELSLSWMTIVAKAVGLPQIRGKIQGKQTIFNGRYQLSDLRTYQQLAPQFSHRLVSDTKDFVAHFCPQNPIELSEVEYCIRQLLPNKSDSHRLIAQLASVGSPSSSKQAPKTKSSAWASLFYSLRRPKKTRIYFSSQRRDGGQPYQLYLWLQAHYPAGDYIWEQKGQLPAEGVKEESSADFKALFSAHYIVTDQLLPKGYMKRHGQVIIKCLPYYPLYKQGMNSPIYQSAVKKRQVLWKTQMKDWDLLLVPDEVAVLEAKSAFGSIRTTIGRFQYVEESKEDLKRRFQLPEDKKIILFYPQETTTSLPIDLSQATDCWIAPETINPSEGLVRIAARMDELVKVADLIVTDGHPDVAYENERPVYWLTSLEQFAVLQKWLDHRRMKRITFVDSKSGQVIQQGNGQLDCVSSDMASLWKECLQAPSHSSRLPVSFRLVMKQIPWRNYYRWVFDVLAKRPKKDIVVFESFYGKQFSDNPRALYEYMKSHYPKYRLYWMTTKKQEEAFKLQGIPTIRQHSWKELWIQTKAKYWVVNMRLPQWKVPGKGTTLIQTWHGTPLKTLGLDIQQVTMPGVTTESYRQQFLNDVRKWDYLIAPNEYSSRIFQRAFCLPQQKMILSGYPRNDVLFHLEKEQIESIRQSLNISPQQKVVLYAPTWRDTNNQGQGSYYLGLQLDLDKMQSYFGDDVVLLIRAHYLISEQLSLDHYPNVRDVSHYPDIAQLYEISDVLITDYSSVFFDYANLHRPMIFYAYDEAEYAGDMRGFYFDYHTVPDPIVHTTDEVIQCLDQALHHPQWNDKDKAFIQRYCQWENGTSSKEVWEVVLNQKQYTFVADKQDGMAYLRGTGYLYQCPFPQQRTEMLTCLSAYKGQKVQLMSERRAKDPIHQQCTSTRYYEIQLTLFSGQRIHGFVLADDLQWEH